MRLLTVTDGRRGILNQALGLAEAIQRQFGSNCEILQHTVSHGSGFAALPPQLQLLTPGRLSLPDADLIIGCGRQAIAPLIALRQNHPSPFTVYVQDPRMDPNRFDMVILPEHDLPKLARQASIVSMIGSPNRITRDSIVTGTLAHAERLSQLPMPRAMIAIGGQSKRHTLSSDCQSQHLKAAQALINKGYSLLITTSRRTPDSAIKAWKTLADHHAQIWLHTPDSVGENPYFAFLGGADLILVTEDSTNMLTEACATGKPVFRLPMEGKPGKFETLYSSLETHCHVTRWTGQDSHPSYAPLRETDRIAQTVIERFQSRH